MDPADKTVKTAILIMHVNVMRTSIENIKENQMELLQMNNISK